MPPLQDGRTPLMTAAKQEDKRTLINAVELFITHVPNQAWAGHFQKQDGANKTFLHHVVERSGGLDSDELEAVSKLDTSSIQAMLLTADKVGIRATCTPVRWGEPADHAAQTRCHAL